MPRPVWVDSQGQGLVDADLFLERAVDEVVAGGWIVLETPQGEARSWLVGATSTQARSDFAISGKSTGLLLREPDGSDFSAFVSGTQVKPELTAFTFRTTTAHVNSELIPLAGLPIKEQVSAGADELMLDSLYLDLAPGRAVSVAGERADAQGVEEAETLVLADVVHTGGHTRLLFAEGPSLSYLRETVRVNANLAPASHGEGVAETLGSGDATRCNQAFPLAKPPLTFVSAATETGSASSITVRVDGIAWRQVPSLWQAGPEDEVYMLRIDDDGTTRVVFGDGAHGRRLPTGNLNVTASYRSGIGVAGEVDEETLIQLKTRPLGVRGVHNPSPAGGAAAAEPLEQARSRAPRSVSTLGRIVSLTDYQDFALTFAGVGKARAATLWRGRERVVHLTVAPATDSVFDQASATLQNLQQAIDRLCPRLELVPLGGDGQALTAGKAAPVPISVGLVWGHQPLAGVTVAFAVSGGDATVQPAQVVTDATGTAFATLIAGQSTGVNDGIVHVTATPVDPPVTSTPVRLSFAARFLQADSVYVGEEICPAGQQVAGDNTVAGLLDYLCSAGGHDPGMHVTGIFHFNETGKPLPLAMDQVLRPALLAKGLLFELDGPVDPAAIESSVTGMTSRPVGEVMLDLPYPVTLAAIGRWWFDDLQPAEALFGYVPTRLDGAFILVSDQNGQQGFGLRWAPTERTSAFLSVQLEVALAEMGFKGLELAARAVLHGNQIWSAKSSSLLLDGDLLADAKQPTGVFYPSGDGKRGGDLVLPFYLGQPAAVGPLVGPREILGLFAITASPFLGSLTGTAPDRLAQAFDLALDRPALAASGLVPSDVQLGSSRAPDLAAARQALRGVTLPPLPLRVLVHENDRRLMTALRRDLAAASGVQVETVVTSAQDPASGFVERLKRDDPGVDVVLADAPILRTIQATPDVRLKLGRSLLRL